MKVCQLITSPITHHPSPFFEGVSFLVRFHDNKQNREITHNNELVMRRKKLSPKKSKGLFRKTAKTKSVNIVKPSPMRGGWRL